MKTKTRKSKFNGFPRDRKSSIDPEVQREQDLIALVSQVFSAQKYFGRNVDILKYIAYCAKTGIPLPRPVEKIVDDLAKACELHVNGITIICDPDTGVEFYHVPERETKGQPPLQKGKNRHNMFGKNAVRARYQAEIPYGAMAFP